MNDAELELVIQQPRLPASLASPVPSRGRAVGAWEEHGGISRCSNASVVSIVVAWPPLIRQTARRPRRASPLVPVHQLSALLLQLLALPRSFCYRGTVRRRCGLRARRSTGPPLPLASPRPSRARQPPCPRRRWSRMLSCRRRMPRSRWKMDCEKNSFFSMEIARGFRKALEPPNSRSHVEVLDDVSCSSDARGKCR